MPSKNAILFSLNQAVNHNLLDENVDINKEKVLKKIQNYIYDGVLEESEVRQVVDRMYPPEEGQEPIEILTLDVYKEKRIEQLKEECTNAIYEGFAATNGHAYGFNNHDQMNFTQQRTEIISGNVADIQWKTQDSGVVIHTVDEFNQVMADAKTHKLEQQTKYWQLEAQILNATTKEEVLSVVW